MKIAITQRVIDFNNGSYDALDNKYYKLFQGHRLRPIPNEIEHYRTSWILDCDIVVFTCGNSMNKDSWEYNEQRLRVEKHTLDLAQLYKKPILGIGRGCQFLTLSLGGSIEKSNRQNNNNTIYYNNTEVEVVSNKKQVLKTVPLGASVLATDEDGYCESWKLDNIITTMWNPERMNSCWMPYEVKWTLGI